MRVVLNVPANARSLTRAVELLVALNRDFLRRAAGRAPSLYRSGVRYQREGRHISGRPRERWQTIPEVLRAGVGDCEDLVGWRVAELREKGVNAAPLITKHGHMFHVRVVHPDGRKEDPSKLLGMNGDA